MKYFFLLRGAGIIIKERKRNKRKCKNQGEKYYPSYRSVVRGAT
jgi:hypothetical protein